jgi:hypothetical protein
MVRGDANCRPAAGLGTGAGEGKRWELQRRGDGGHRGCLRPEREEKGEKSVSLDEWIGESREKIR